MARRCLVIGVAGGIGMGKSGVTAQFARLGAKTCSSDAVVHRLLGPGGKAVAAVAAQFPQALTEGRIDREALGGLVFGNEAKLKQLERLLHPLVVAEEKAFIRRADRLGARLVVLDIPLLFETGAEKRLDAVVTASATHYIQRKRVLRRPRMTEEKLRAILARQLPDAVKRRRADFVVRTGLGYAFSFRQVKMIVRKIP